MARLFAPRFAFTGLLVSTLVGLGPAGAQARPRPAQDVPEGYTPGETMTLGRGVKETVAQIMARDALLPHGALPVRLKPEPQRPPERQPDPLAPDVSRWPAPPEDEADVPELLRRPGPTLPQTIGTSFLAMRLADSGFIPPDSMGDVGPTQILTAANGRIRVYDKNGNLGPLNTTMDNFFAAVGGLLNGTSDPHVRYDRLSQRWFVVIVDIGAPTCPNSVLLAASSGPTITSQSSFSFFSFVGEAGTFTDYPTLGVDKHALYIGGNMFNIPQLGCSGDSVNTTAWVVRKTDLLNNILTVTAFRGLVDSGAGVGMWTPQGAHNDDPAATEGYFIGVDFFLFSRLGIRRVLNPGGTPLLSGQISLTTPTTTSPIDQVQPSPGRTLDALDDRLFAVMIKRNKLTGAATLWTAHNIQVNSGGVGDNSGLRNGSRWYEIGSLTTTPAILQAGTLFDPAGTTPFGYWIPSIAATGQGHAGIASSRASANGAGGHASIAAAGRLRTDGLGLTQAPTLAQASSFIYNVQPSGPQRWGDYSQVGVDPNDDQTLWTFQEYTDATNSWGVRAIKLVAPPPATPASAFPATVIAGQPSLNVIVTGTSTAGSEFFDPGADTGGPGFASRIQASVSGGVTVNSVVFNSPTQVTLNVSTVGATAGAKNVTITNPDGQGATGTGLLNVIVCPAITINPATIPTGRTGTAYSQTFTQTGAGPGTFTLSGSLPAGLAFTPATATLAGTPTQVGVFPIVVNFADANGCPGSRGYDLTVGSAGVLAPIALGVDAANNAVFEPGETVAVAPTWFNGTGGTVASLTSTASAFTGPAGPTYTLVDASANYGSLANDLAATCTATGNCFSLQITAGTRPAAHWDASFLETPSTGSPKTWTLHLGSSFGDVPTSNPFYRFIETLLHKGVTGGCGASAYCPGNSTTREQMAVFVLRAKEGSGYTPPPCAPPNLFADVPATSPFCAWIEELANRGVVSGCGGGNYCPANPVTREQMAVFMLRAKEGSAFDPPACAPPNVFADVPETSPFCRWIEELAARGVVAGCGGGNYCPASPVTRAQMSVFLGRTFTLQLYAP